MNETERELDLMVAELNVENKMLKEQHERLTRELNATAAERDRFKEALERILAVSRVALWGSERKTTFEVGSHTSPRVIECND